MHLLPKKIPWFTIAITSIFILSLTLRFWGLGRFNTLVFDEVYYAKYAVNYLNGREVFDAHPPLGKYLIALGIWLYQLFSQFFPIASQNANDLTGQVLPAVSYRWMNALVGSCIPLVVSGIAYQLSDRRSYAIIAGFLMAIEGIFLVESRYALINIYLVFFGLLAQWLVLQSTQLSSPKKELFLLGSGICFGASVSVKWNGLGFWLGVVGIYSIVRSIKLITSNLSLGNHFKSIESENPNINLSLFPRFANLKLSQILLNWVCVPTVIYWLVWIPHLQFNPTETFRSLHQQILSYHQTGVGTGSDVHPYCSRWYTWPLMLRSISYFYERSTHSEPNSIIPPLPRYLSEGIYDVHLLGNPILWWLSSAAILIFVCQFIEKILESISSKYGSLNLTKDDFIIVYLMMNYAANFLPWIFVRRCTFLYLYMSALVFAILALAWIIDRWWNSDRPQSKIFTISTISIVFLALIFWLPIYLGLPLSPAQFQIRMLLPSWV
ncbi:MAG: phospholipid carrier-dependent glycosyltransferase [Cyanobacteriota bacterium]|nr:phospholipid carrier-dependent glycosyltransferase [Cyanobacteriota bacterium]